MTTFLNRITVDPEQCGGRPCIRGMRIRVSDVLDLFSAGLSAEQILSRDARLGNAGLAGVSDVCQPSY